MAEPEKYPERAEANVSAKVEAPSCVPDGEHFCTSLRGYRSDHLSAANEISPANQIALAVTEALISDRPRAFDRNAPNIDDLRAARHDPLYVKDGERPSTGDLGLRVNLTAVAKAVLPERLAAAITDVPIDVSPSSNMDGITISTGKRF